MINKVILVGNVGMDPEVRTMENGVKVARLRVATTERFFNRQTNEAREHTEWHTVILWRSLADVADRLLHKGSQIYVEGHLRTREWTDNNNNKRTSTEIEAETMKLLGRRDYNNQNGGQNNGASGYNNNSGYNNSGYNNSGYNTPNGGNNSYGQGSGYGQNAGGNNHTAAPQPPVTAPADDPDDLPF